MVTTESKLIWGKGCEKAERGVCQERSKGQQSQERVKDRENVETEVRGTRESRED